MSFTIQAFPTIDRPLDLARPIRHLAGVPLAAPELEDFKGVLHALLDDPARATISMARLQDLWRARRDSQLRMLLQSVALVTPRGPALEMIVGRRDEARLDDIANDRYTSTLLEVLAERGKSCFFVGGKDTEPFDWARRAVVRNEGIRIAGALAPGPDFRDAAGCRKIVRQLNRSHADVAVILPDQAKAEHFSLCYRSMIQADLVVVLFGGPHRDWTRRGPSLFRARREYCARDVDTRLSILREFS